MHVDMDAFYAAVEERDDPSLRGQPLVIGADPQSGAGRGVVSTANYEARRYGIGSAQPISQAYRACPEANFVRPDFTRYKAASRQVMHVLGQYADVLQIAGLDEAYLDITAASHGDWTKARSLARSLKACVKRSTGLTCSIGVAPNKAVAKIASDHRKPSGITVVTPASVTGFLAPQPVSRINGCGPKTAARLQDMDIHTIHDLANADAAALAQHFGNHGAWLQAVAKGHDERPVAASRGPPKSASQERTFARDEDNPDTVIQAAQRLLRRLLGDRKHAFATLGVKVRYSDFSTYTRDHTFPVPLDPDHDDAPHIASATLAVLLGPLLDGRPVRLVGVRLGNLCQRTGQRPLSRFGCRVRAPYHIASPAGAHVDIRPMTSQRHRTHQHVLT